MDDNFPLKSRLRESTEPDPNVSRLCMIFIEQKLQSQYLSNYFGLRRFPSYLCVRQGELCGNHLYHFHVGVVELFDYVDIIIAPVLIGGQDTATLVDGESIRISADLDKLGVLQLEKAETLENSYVRLRYKVIG